MPPSSEGQGLFPLRPGGMRLLAWHLLFGLSLIFSAPALAVDTRLGQRKLGVALASSATELKAGREVSTPRTPETLLLMFLINPRYNAFVFKNPEVVPSVLDRLTEPGFLVAVYQAALHPKPYLHFAEGWTDPEKLRSYFEVIDPKVFLAWARALSNPGYYADIVLPLAEQRKLLAWLAFLFGSRTPDLIGPLLDPRTGLAWLTLPVNPDLTAHLAGPMRMLNPAQWGALAGTLMVSGQHVVQRFADQAELADSVLLETPAAGDASGAQP